MKKQYETAHETRQQIQQANLLPLNMPTGQASFQK